MKNLLPFLLLIFLLSCSNNNSLEKKGFQVNEILEDETGEKILGLKIDSLTLQTQPRNVLRTKNPSHRLTPIYKINYNKKTKKPFIGSNEFHSNYWGFVYNEPNNNYNDNNWNYNFMPGFEAVYGYNFVNISHYNNETKQENRFFDTPVLIRTLYYPALSKDTLNGTPIVRSFHMVSAYDEDTNKDGYINAKDLRRFYHFDINGIKQAALVPQNYSVMNSEYDPQNDFMYVFAKLDKNENGKMEYEEPIYVFWIDLKNPVNRGRQFEGK